MAEQWQDELYRRFHLSFEILTNDKLEAARTGNWFMEANPMIVHLDKLVEAHKMSATFFGGNSSTPSATRPEITRLVRKTGRTGETQAALF